MKPFDYIAGNTKLYWQHELTSGRVAFVGKNRKGKTARRDGLTLALTGKHPVGPHGTDLFALAPENALELRAECRGPDGHSAFRVEKIAGKPKKPPEKPDRGGALKDLEARSDADEVFEAMVPTITMRDLIKGSTLTRELIFRRFGDVTTLPVPRGLSPDQTKMWDATVAAVRRDKPKADTAESLAEIASAFRRAKLAAGTDIRSLEKLVKERETELRTRVVGAEDLPRLRKQLSDARTWEQTTDLRRRKIEIEADAEGYRAKVIALTALDEQRERVLAERAEALRAQDAAIAALDAQIAAVDEKIKKEVFFLTGGDWVLECLHRMDGAIDASGRAACLLCANMTEPAAIRREITPRINARRASVETLYAERDAIVRAKTDALAMRNAWLNSNSETDRAVELDKVALRQEYERIKSAREENSRALASAPEAYAGPTAIELDTRIRGLEAADVASKQLDGEYKKLRELQTKQGLCQTLEQETARVLSELLATTAINAEAAVNRYMPAGFMAVLDVESAQWQVIGSDGRAHKRKTMSGSEFGALLPALACAWTEKSPIRFLFLDDEDLAPFDPENLALLLDHVKTLQESGFLTQVFVFWSRGHEIPEDWGQKIYVESPVIVDSVPVPPPTNAVAPSNTPTLLL